jgi:hypothetical protein
MEQATGEIGEIARRTAGRLAGELGARLPADVEAALHEVVPRPADRFILDPVSLRSLVVGVAGLAWSIYHEIKTDGRFPSPLAPIRWIISCACSVGPG